MSVLARFGGCDLNELAGLGLKHGVAAFAQGGGLGWEGEGGVCVAGCLFLSVIAPAFRTERVETYLSSVFLILGKVGRHVYAVFGLV